MAEPYVRQCFQNYDEFSQYLKAYCDRSSQTFVVDDSRRIETHAKLHTETQLKYCFVRLTCVKYARNRSERIDRLREADHTVWHEA